MIIVVKCINSHLHACAVHGAVSARLEPRVDAALVVHAHARQRAHAVVQLVLGQADRAAALRLVARALHELDVLGGQLPSRQGLQL